MLLGKQAATQKRKSEAGARPDVVSAQVLPLRGSIEEQLLCRYVKRFREWLVFEAHRLVHHSTIASAQDMPLGRAGGERGRKGGDHEMGYSLHPQPSSLTPQPSALKPAAIERFRTR